VDGEAILSAEIDHGQIVRGKFDLDVVAIMRGRTSSNSTLMKS